MQEVTAFFSIGLFTQTLILGYESKWFRPIKIAIIVALFFYVYLYLDQLNSANKDNFPILFPAFAYLGICAFYYRDWMIKKISELSIITVTMTLLYAVLRFGDFNLLELRIQDIILITPFVLFLAFLIMRVDMNKKIKLILYSWFLFASSLVILFQLWSIRYIFREEQVYYLGSALSLIFAGMISFYIIANIMHILMLVPFSSTEDSARVAKEHVHKISQSIVGNNLAPKFALIVVLVLSLVFLINLQFKFIPDLLLVNVMIIFSLYYPSSRFIPEIT